MKDCKTCAYFGNHDCFACHDKAWYKPMTNADRIRAMTDYDLADWIAKILLYHGKVALNEYHVDCDKRCPLYKCCNDQPYDNIEDWLKSPVEEET